MKLELNEKEYDVIITYKNNKNMYLRIKEDLNIYISAPKFISKKEIKKFIEDNIDIISKDLKEKELRVERLNNKVTYLGNYYDICYINNSKIIFTNDKVFVKRNFNLDNWYRKQAKSLFQERLDYNYNLFNEKIPYPLLKIRKMKSKWGVCNVTKKTITLNLELIKMQGKYLDYVIIHELSHLVYPNHSKNFWLLVEKYEPNYKKYRKEMKNQI